MFLPFWAPLTFTVGKPTVWGSGIPTVACSCGHNQEFNPIFLSRGGSRTAAWWCLQEALSQKTVGAEVLPFLVGCIARVLNVRHDSTLAALMLTEWDRHSPALQTHELGAVPQKTWHHPTLLAVGSTEKWSWALAWLLLFLGSDFCTCSTRRKTMVVLTGR